jgi:hypothetical protein
MSAYPDALKAHPGGLGKHRQRFAVGDSNSNRQKPGNKQRAGQKNFSPRL